MKLLKNKSEDSRARRHARRRVLRARTVGMMMVGMAALISLGAFAAYHFDAVKKSGDWMRDRALTVTAESGFKVKDILVTGRSRVEADDLLNRLSIKADMPILGIDIAAAQKSLSGLVWIRDVSISRRLPDKIFVDLHERVPVAIWQYQKKLSVIDADGVSLPVDDVSAYKDLPLVVGADVPAHVMSLMTLLQAEPVVADMLASAVRVGGRRWDLHLKNGMTVKLPEENAGLAVSTLALAEKEKNILSRKIVSIDLRLPERMVILPAAASSG